MTNDQKVWLRTAARLVMWGGCFIGTLTVAALEVATGGVIILGATVVGSVLLWLGDEENIAE